MRLKSKTLALFVDSSSPMVLMAELGNNRRSSTPPQVKSWRPCFNFAKGACRFGESCRYVHDVNAKPGPNNNASSSRGCGTLDNTTNDLLNKLLQQLGNMHVVNPTIANTPTPSPAVAFTDGPTSFASQPASPVGPPGFSHPSYYIGPTPTYPILTYPSRYFVLSTSAKFRWNQLGTWGGGGGGGGRHPIPVTNTGHSVLPTPHGSLRLNNVLITPSIVTSPSSIPQAYLVSQHTWHQCLGHPRCEVLRRVISSSFISCNKEKPYVLCHACHLDKHVRLPFVGSKL
ncbi:ribonuclease H-like domain-containing protein [Tanacetum coccineum]